MQYLIRRSDIPAIMQLIVIIFFTDPRRTQHQDAVSCQEDVTEAWKW